MRIGIDVGGTGIKAGIVSNGKIVKKIEGVTPQDKEQFISVLFAVIDYLFDKKVKSIGIGFPAPVIDGKVYEVQNIPQLNGLNVKKLVENKYKVKCSVDNDANAFALAEQQFGSAKGSKNVVGITLGTGLGCGIVIDGEIYRGQTGAAGEISRIKIGNKTLENTANTRFIKRISGEKPHNLYDLAKKGNKSALKSWEKYGTSLGQVISVVVNTLDPEIIVIGGKIAEAYPYFEKFIIPELKKSAFKYTVSKTKIVKAKIKNSAVIGAACL